MKYVQRGLVQKYNGIIKQIAAQHSVHYGIDTPLLRHHEAKWCRQLRRDYPLSNYMVTWS